MIRAIAFDLDHTLFDRYATLKEVSKKLRELLPVNPELSDDDIYEIMVSHDRNFVHLGWKRLQDELNFNSPLFTRPLEEDGYRMAVMGEFMNVAVPFPFTVPTLEQLKSRGYKLALITNGRSELQRRKIEMLGFEKYFDEIYVGGEHEKQKPSTEPFLYIAEKLGVDPNEMVYVGDNPENDVEASRKAGCLPVFVNTTKTWVLPNIEKAPYTVETVQEIPELIENINAAE
ncbi:MAG: HAD family hydrolase [Ruminococcaceae bacterium]|nr:HAD family hydrolase [Oscillospiraceae bacterium]